VPFQIKERYFFICIISLVEEFYEEVERSKFEKLDGIKKHINVAAANKIPKNLVSQKNKAHYQLGFLDLYQP
jgi:hypothetical protein